MAADIGGNDVVVVGCCLSLTSETAAGCELESSRETSMSDDSVAAAGAG